eukprot:FR739538.1.p1 GENE.FR739538.1~~FR739538.1.p1  ORF type:complete len:294 (+),score=32.01 FR739538.1:60-884(+)
MNASPLIKDHLEIKDLRKRILGIDQLITEEEVAILLMVTTPKAWDGAQNPKGKIQLPPVDMRTKKVLQKPENAQVLVGSSGNGAMLTVLVWLQTTFDKMAEEGVIFGPDISPARKVAVFSAFEDNLCTLRGGMATFGFFKQFPVPLGYVQLLQFLVDVTCFLAPFTFIYEIDSLVVENAGFLDHEPWSIIVFILIATGSSVFFLQGLFSLAETLCEPFGTKDAIDKYSHQLEDKEFLFNVKLIMKQTRLGQFTFMNSKVQEYVPQICWAGPSAE